MKLAVWTNIYEGLNDKYLDEWRKAMGRQLDMKYEILFSTLEGCNTTLKHAVENYDAILFLDIDDIPEQALVHIAKINAREHDITAFAMKMVDEDNNEIGRFGRMVNVSTYNVWGFGNTIYTSEVLKKLLPINIECDTPDWDTVKRANSMGVKLSFCPSSLVRYRQYKQNDRLVKVGDVYVWK